LPIVVKFYDHITGGEMAKNFCGDTSYKKRLQNIGLGNVKGRADIEYVYAYGRIT
jgi:hypothetical protein